MAMTDEELLLQMNILASKTSDNPNMVYKTNATLNKGLNPAYFSGNYTKIVNAINNLAVSADQANTAAQNVSDKLNEILLDTSSEENQQVWENLKAAMGQPTIIQGLTDLYAGKQIDKMLGLDAKDAGKVVSIDTDDKGNLILKAVEQGIVEIPEVKATDIAYVNNYNDSISNVKNALDFVIDKVANGNIGEDNGGLGGGFIMGDITWDMIEDRPEVVADKISLSSTHLELKDGDTVVSSVPLLSDSEVDNMLNKLDE